MFRTFLLSRRCSTDMMSLTGQIEREPVSSTDMQSLMGQRIAELVEALMFHTFLLSRRCSTDILSLTGQIEREPVSFYRYAVPNGTEDC